MLKFHRKPGWRENLFAAFLAMAGGLHAQSAPDCCTGLPITFPGIDSPGQIALNPVNGELFVTNSSDRTLRVFNSATGAPVTVFSSWSGGVTFVNPSAVACDSSGNFYVSDYGRGVEEFNPSFAYVGLIGPGNSTGTYVDNEGVTTSLYVCSQDNNVYRYDSLSGGAYAAAATFGAGVLSQPDALVKVGNMVYVTDEAGMVIGFPVPGYSPPTTLYSNATSPMRGICAGSNGIFYATELANTALDIFSSSFGSNPPTCSPPAPWGVAVNSSGNLYISEFNGTVTVLQGCGAQATPPIPNCCQAGWTITSGPLPDVNGLAYDSSGPGTLYAGGGATIFSLNPLTGGLINVVPNSFDSITAMALGRDGYLYVADYNNKLFQVQVPSGTIQATLNLPGEAVRSLSVAPEASHPDIYIGCDSGNVYHATWSGSSYSLAQLSFSPEANPIHEQAPGILFVPGASGAPATFYLSDCNICQRVLQYVQTGPNTYAYNNLWQTSNGNIYMGQITQDASGNIYVGAMVEYLAFSPAFSLRWACPIAPVYGRAIALDPFGNVYTGHQSQETILKLHCPVSGPTATPTSSYQGSNPPGQGQCFVYPSPAKGSQAKVCYNMAGAGQMELKIWNWEGGLAGQWTDQKPAGIQTTPFDISGFAPGVYFYEVQFTYASGRTDKSGPHKFAVIR